MFPLTVTDLKQNPKLTVTSTEPPANDNAKLDAGETGSSESDEDSSDISGSAYRKAWNSLTEDQRKELTFQDGIRELFVQLNKTDEQHKSQSLLRKGLSAVGPYLERLQVTIDFVSPFASMEPAAGTALGLVKGATSVRRNTEPLRLPHRCCFLYRRPILVRLDCYWNLRCRG